MQPIQVQPLGYNETDFPYADAAWDYVIASGDFRGSKVGAIVQIWNPQGRKYRVYKFDLSRCH